VSIDATDILDADLRGKTTQITVRFASDLLTVMRPPRQHHQKQGVTGAKILNLLGVLDGLRQPPAVDRVAATFAMRRMTTGMSSTDNLPCIHSGLVRMRCSRKGGAPSLEAVRKPPSSHSRSSARMRLTRSGIGEAGCESREQNGSHCGHTRIARRLW
jgi:hypothetical protein